MKNTTNNNGGLPKAPQAVPPLPKRSVKTVVWVVLGVLLLVVIAGIAYQRQQADKRAEAAYQADRASFAQVEKDMAAAYNQMTANDKPVKEEYSRQCSRISQKLNDGPIVCSVTYVYSYDLGDVKQALTRTETFRKVLEANKFTQKGSTRLDDITGINTPFYEDSTSVGADYALEGQDVSCKLSFGPGDEFFGFEEQYSAYELQCDKFADRPVYTFVD